MCYQKKKQHQSFDYIKKIDGSKLLTLLIMNINKVVSDIHFEIPATYIKLMDEILLEINEADMPIYQEFRLALVSNVKLNETLNNKFWKICPDKFRSKFEDMLRIMNWSSDHFFSDMKWNALHRAIAWGNSDVVEFLLRVRGCKITNFDEANKALNTCSCLINLVKDETEKKLCRKNCDKIKQLIALERIEIFV